MSTVQEIETAIANLSETDFAELRGWIWDRDIERDSAAGRLEEPANEALREHRSGQTKRL
jgi:hypothetical protein